MKIFFENSVFYSNSIHPLHTWTIVDVVVVVVQQFAGTWSIFIVMINMYAVLFLTNFEIWTDSTKWEAPSTSTTLYLIFENSLSAKNRYSHDIQGGSKYKSTTKFGGGRYVLMEIQEIMVMWREA